MTMGSDKTTLRVAVVEDQEKIRDGLRILIDRTPGFRCVAACADMEHALDLFARAAPQVALVDIGLPGISGIDGTRILKERFPELQVIILTVYDDDDRVFRALCAGASGYLLKNIPQARLMEGIREVANGGSPVSPEIARRIIVLFQRVNAPEHGAKDLTPHETRILKLLVEGHNYKTAAVELDVSVNTVSFHVRRIYEKLQVHSKSEAVAKALRNNLVR
jgi:DNA-binding NarL/FixJ family response regulator